MRHFLRLALALIVVCAACAVRAQVTTPHPRLMLDAPTLTLLRARAAANTPQWQQLKSYCDSFIGGTVNPPAVGGDVYNSGNDYPDLPNIGQGYQGSSYWSAALAEGLCYQTLKTTDPTTANAYGDKVVQILLAMATSCGSNPQTCQPTCTDSGYGTRFYGVGFGLGYDWAYDRLSAAQKSQIYTTANAWLASFADINGCSGFEYAVPDGNYYAGYFHAAAAIALATYGDNPSAPQLWSDWQNQEFATLGTNAPHVGVQPYFAAHMTGGGWPEGFGNYGPLATQNMSLPAWEVKTATGTDLIHAAAPYSFPLDAADYLIHFTWPSRDYIDDRDTNHATGDPVTPPGTANMNIFAQVLGVLRYYNAPRADVFQEYANEVNAAVASDGGDEPWQKFLFWDPNGTTAPLASLPLAYFATGLNAVAARSDWGTSASWISFRAAPYIDNPGAGEEGFDQGSIAIVRGKTPLVVNGTGQIVHEPNGDADENRIYNDNFVDFDGTPYTSNRQIYGVYFVRSITGSTVNQRYGQAAYTAEDDNARTHVASFEDGNAYVFALATQLEDMYRPATSGPQVVTWSRAILYLRPNRFVVYDRTTAGNASGSSTADDQFIAFDFAANPVLGSAPSGEKRYDVTVGSTYAGAMTTVLPANNAVSIVGLYPANGSDAGSSPVKVWQAQVRAPNTNATQQWLSVFDTSTAAAQVATATAIVPSNGNLVGTLLSGSSNTALLFNGGSAGTPYAGSVTYRVPQAPTLHVLTELTPNAGYSVAVAVGSSNHDVTVSPGGAITSSTHGVLIFSVAADGTVGPGDRIFANGFN
jgi:hypothetical protein